MLWGSCPGRLPAHRHKKHARLTFLDNRKSTTTKCYLVFSFQHLAGGAPDIYSYWVSSFQHLAGRAPDIYFCEFSLFSTWPVEHPISYFYLTHKQQTMKNASTAHGWQWNNVSRTVFSVIKYHGPLDSQSKNSTYLLKDNCSYCPSFPIDRASTTVIILFCIKSSIYLLKNLTIIIKFFNKSS